MNKHKTVPIFIPHLGCPHQCTFCNQHTITDAHAPTPEQVKVQIADMVATLPKNAPRTLAFFGGSFTALPRADMIAYLSAAQDFSFDSIRISTRPDAIDSQILSILRHYGVTHIELGLQSMDDAVLSATRRGHTAAQAARACAQVVQAGFVLGGQMMIGLPAATPQSEVDTAHKICALGAKEARLYPLCVLSDTPLAAQVARGEFTPISQSDAVRRTADALRILLSHSVKLLRIGLCANEGLTKEQVLGDYHPAFGELVYNTLYYDRIAELLCAYPQAALVGAHATVGVARGARSRAIGQKRQNLRALSARFPLQTITVQEDDSLCGFDCTLTFH